MRAATPSELALMCDNNRLDVSVRVSELVGEPRAGVWLTDAMSSSYACVGLVASRLMRIWGHLTRVNTREVD